MNRGSAKFQYKIPSWTSHSIIAVLGEGSLTSRTDGVVSYESAHIDGVTSELIVHSGHKDTLKQSRMCAEFSESTSKQNKNSV